jgi:hypothetical protein
MIDITGDDDALTSSVSGFGEIFSFNTSGISA